MSRPCRGRRREPSFLLALRTFFFFRKNYPRTKFKTPDAKFSVLRIVNIDTGTPSLQEVTWKASDHHARSVPVLVPPSGYFVPNFFNRYFEDSAGNSPHQFRHSKCRTFLIPSKCRTFLIPSKCHTFLIPSKCRRFLIPSKCRTFLIPSKCRTFLIPSKCRTFLIPSKCRTFLIPSPTSPSPMDIGLTFYRSRQIMTSGCTSSTRTRPRSWTTPSWRGCCSRSRTGRSPTPPSSTGT